MKAQSFLLTSVLIILFSSKGFCCMNEYWQLLNGKLHIVEERQHPHRVPRYDGTDSAELSYYYDLVKSRYKKEPNLENYSDYAAMLVYKGRFQKAKSILLEIESKAPNKYNTAANLGTTYELLGQNDSALFWIKKALELNPKSHFGSEWIHIRILEEKIKAGNDTSYFNTHRILNMDFDQDSKPKMLSSDRSLQDVGEQVFYQISERMIFIKPKDAVIAQLTFDLANIYALQDRFDEAFYTISKARDYGFVGEIADKRESYFREILSKQYDERNRKELGISEPSNEMNKIPIPLIVGGLLILVGAIFFIKKRKLYSN